MRIFAAQLLFTTALLSAAVPLFAHHSFSAEYDILHIVERYTFLDANTMQYQATMDDASVYTRPWTISARMLRTHRNEPGYELWEDACHEGERNADNSLVTNEQVSQGRK